MATDFESTVFETQLEAVRELPEAARWNLQRDKDVPLGVLATMHPRASAEELYTAQVRWTELFKAPSVKFVDQEGQETPSAWPKCFGFRPGSLDACLPWTAEGQKLHPEWANSVNAYPTVDAPVQFILLHLQSSLDSSYEGRGS